MGGGQWKTIKFWKDCWVCDKSLALVALQQVLKGNMESKVADYSNQDRWWKWEELSILLLATTLLRMALIAVSDVTEVKDRLAWDPTPTEEFWVKLAYAKCCHWGLESAWNRWECVCGDSKWNKESKLSFGYWHTIEYLQIRLDGSGKLRRVWDATFVVR